jgi:hypothetical protein
MREQNPTLKDNASKEEKAVARKLCYSLQDNPTKYETSAQ